MADNTGILMFILIIILAGIFQSPTTSQATINSLQSFGIVLLFAVIVLVLAARDYGVIPKNR